MIFSLESFVLYFAIMAAICCSSSADSSKLRTLLSESLFMLSSPKDCAVCSLSDENFNKEWTTAADILLNLFSIILIPFLKKSKTIIKIVCHKQQPFVSADLKSDIDIYNCSSVSMRESSRTEKTRQFQFGPGKNALEARLRSAMMPAAKQRTAQRVPTGD